MMARPLHLPALLLVTALLPVVGALGGCDNVGLAFDPVIGHPTTPTGPATIQVPPARGDLRDGRPQVRATNPKAGGWPTTVPIVVEFSESMNEASVRPTSTGGADGKVIVRVKGTTQALPAQYDFLGGGRLLVVRPTPALSNSGSPSYEVVLLPGARDADGLTVAGSAEQILAEFTVDAPTTAVDGEILTLFPRDNARDVARETDYVCVFTRAANASSITTTAPATFQLTDSAGAVVPGALSLPLNLLGVNDPRVVVFTPSSTLAAANVHQLTVTSGITFGQSGTLQFNNRTPFARFTTTGVPGPTSVTVGNPSTGFPDKINRSNFGSLAINVAVPADAAAGDRVVARIYGGDRSTAATNDIRFFERSATLAVGGLQTQSLSFAGALGGLDTPLLDEGAVTFAAQLQRGSAHSGIVLGSGDALLDTTIPAIVRFGPPGPATGTEVDTDQESLALYGTASEAIGSASLSDGSSPVVDLFACASDGRFVLEPLALGRRTTRLSFSLGITDLAGNVSAAPVTGDIVQRGLLTGTVAGTLTVVAYDDTTLLPVANATVLVDPNEPVVPPVGRLSDTTASDGSVTFPGLTALRHTITIAHASYHLATLYNTGAAFVSLPLHPRTGATATLRGTVAFQPQPNTTVLVGSNLFDDPTLLAVGTTAGNPTAIPPTAIQANRPQVLTAFAGTFEPTAVPTFSATACQMLGVTLNSKAPPAAPALPATETTQTLTLLPTTGLLIAQLGSLVSEDYGPAAASGLDLANLVGGVPTVRFTMSLLGFPGQCLLGVGFATAGAGTVFQSNGNYSPVLLAGLQHYVSNQWVVTEARDTSGNLTRHRAVLSLTGQPTDRMDPLPIPTITPPSGTFTGPPSIAFGDVIDPAAVTGLAMFELTAQDSDGRQWTVLGEDGDPAGGTRTVQFPDLGATIGLRAGSWSVRASARTALSGSSQPGDLVLAEMRRQELGFARSASVAITVQ